MKKKLSGILYMLFAACIITSNAYTQANTNLSNLVSPTAANQSLSPNANNRFDLGSIKTSWRFLFIDSQIYIKDILTIHSIGTGNFFAGQNAGNLSLTGSYNSGFGKFSLNGLTTGYNNVAVGYKSLFNNISGSLNTAIGYASLLSNSLGSANTATGYAALQLNVFGNGNSAFGSSALNQNISGAGNTAIGESALAVNSTGNGNTAMGQRALSGSQFAGGCTALGYYAMASNSGSSNTAAGNNSMRFNGTGSDNSAFGTYSLLNNEDGSNNTAVGSRADVSTLALSNVTVLGYDSKATASDQVRIGNTSVLSIGGYVDWSRVSDGRFKKNIKENVYGLAFINKLKAVTYNLDITSLNSRLRGKRSVGEETKDMEKLAVAVKEKVVYSGFVAQDVERAAKETGYEFSGIDAPKNKEDLYGLRYAEFVVPLVKAVQELSAQNTAMQERIEKLEAILKTKSSNALSGNGSLEQNIPNPAGNSTRIVYTLPSTFNTGTINITDVAGKLIKSLSVSGTGRNILKLDTGGMSSGIYQYSLYAGEKLVDSRQIVVIKQ